MSLSCTLLVCAAPLAYRWPNVAEALRVAGCEVSVVLTGNASTWDINKPNQEQPDPRRPDVLVICPLTFNTTTKLALGIADTPEHSLAVEAFASGTHVVAVPMINQDLFGHPALSGHLRTLTDAGVQLVDPRSGTAEIMPLQSGMGRAVGDAFDVDALAQAVRNSVWKMAWRNDGGSTA